MRMLGDNMTIVVIAKWLQIEKPLAGYFLTLRIIIYSTLILLLESREDTYHSNTW